MLMFVILMVVWPFTLEILQEHFAENETLGWPQRHLDTQSTCVQPRGNQTVEASVAQP